MYCISCVSVCVKYKDRGSEGSPFRDMLSLVAGRGGLACLGKDSPEGAAVEHSNFIIPHDYFVCAGDSKSHIFFFPHYNMWLFYVLRYFQHSLFC